MQVICLAQQLALAQQLENELRDMTMQRDRLSSELDGLRATLHRLSQHNAYHSASPTASPNSPRPLSEYERPKFECYTDDGPIWLAADEQSQLVVSPPRKRRRTRSVSPHHAYNEGIAIAQSLWPGLRDEDP